jgi:hypothetical protein
MKVASDVLLLSYLDKFGLRVTVEAGQALACLYTVKALSLAKGPKFGQCRVYLQKELSTRKIAVTDEC